MTAEPHLTSSRAAGRLSLVATGAWVAAHANEADRLVGNTPVAEGDGHSVTVDVSGVTALDTFGAWILERLRRGFSEHGREAEFVGLSPRFQGLVRRVHEVNRKAPRPAEAPGILGAALRATLRFSAWLENDAASFFAMLGMIGAATWRVVLHPRSFRMTSAVHQLDRVGWKAIGIIVLITFLIGGIIAQQGIFHLRRFGAEDYAVDMVGILVMRELGVLIVAIMVAGRSGSSYTAELGSMKMREEIDALRTMGLDPVEILILPRVVALVIALPILTFIGSIAALYGGGVVAWLYGDMSPAVYLARLRDAVSITHFEVGMFKAPFMALVIGVVAAAEGLRVKGSAESLGLQTTTSVVKSIFLVIVLDGLFAIFFASIGM